MTDLVHVPSADLDLELEELVDVPLVEQLEAIPMHVQIDPTVDLDAAVERDVDPSLVDTASGQRRVCISSRKAGGRCTVGAMRGSLLCAAHSGLLDPAAGGKAKARRHREASQDAEETARLGRLGTRGVIAATLAERPMAVRGMLNALLDAAQEGDLAASKALIPWLNQGLGMPTETVRSTVDIGSAAELDELTDEQLAALVADKRAALRLVDADPAAA